MHCGPNRCPHLHLSPSGLTRGPTFTPAMHGSSGQARGRQRSGVWPPVAPSPQPPHTRCHPGLDPGPITRRYRGEARPSPTPPPVTLGLDPRAHRFATSATWWPPKKYLSTLPSPSPIIPPISLAGRTAATRRGRCRTWVRRCIHGSRRSSRRCSKNRRPRGGFVSQNQTPLRRTRLGAPPDA
jgi:hypothetical protein